MTTTPNNISRQINSMSIDAAGLLHTCEDAHMVDEAIDFQNGFLNAEQLEQWFQEQSQLQTLEN